MAGSVNKVILVGNLGRDPEVRHSQDGTKVVSLSIATSENWKDRQTGERRDRTEWHRVVIFNERLSDVAEKYLKKGASVYIEGQLQTRKWSDPNGQERYTTEVIMPKFKGEIVMLESRNNHASESGALNYETTNQALPAANSSSNQTSLDDFQDEVSTPLDDFEDEIPF